MLLMNNVTASAELPAEPELTHIDSNRPSGKQHKLHSWFLAASSGLY